MKGDRQSTSDILAIYTREVARHRILTQDEERTYGRQSVGVRKLEWRIGLDGLLVEREVLPPVPDAEDAAPMASTPPRRRDLFSLASWTAYTGQAAEAATGRGWLEMIHPDDRHQIDLALEQCGGLQARPARGDDAPRAVVTVRMRYAPTGEERQVLAHVAPVFSEKGKLLAWAGTWLDAEDQAVAEAAQEKLVTANLRFVITIAKRYRHHGIPLMDLIQAGNLGLMHAARKFDPEVGVRFVTYGVFWVQQQIQKEIDQSNGSVRATQTQMVRLRRIRRLQAEFRQSKGREPSMQELIEATGFTAARINEALNYRVTIKSLDEPVSPADGTTTTLGQIIGHDDGAAEAEDEREQQEVVARVMNEVLAPRERKVLRDYYGFGGKRESSLTDIGVLENISRERARQLKERALKKLRARADLHPLLAQVYTTVADVEARRQARLPSEEFEARLTAVLEAREARQRAEREAAAAVEAETVAAEMALGLPDPRPLALAATSSLPLAAHAGSPTQVSEVTLASDGVSTPTARTTATSTRVRRTTREAPAPAVEQADFFEPA